MRAPVLLVVDMLNDFFDRHEALRIRRAMLTRAINATARAVRARGCQVIWVRQEFADDLSDAFLEMRDGGHRVTMAGTRGAAMLDELDVQSTDPVIVKKRYSAFFGTDLDERLALLRPDPLIVAGVNTSACIRMTVIDAYQRDIRVVVPEEAVAAADVAHGDISAEYLRDSIATFLPTEELLRRIRLDR